MRLSEALARPRMASGSRAACEGEVLPVGPRDTQAPSVAAGHLDTSHLPLPDREPGLLQRSHFLGKPSVSCTLSWNWGWKGKPYPSGLTVVHVCLLPSTHLNSSFCLSPQPRPRAGGRAAFAGGLSSQRTHPSSSLCTGFDLMDLFRVKEILGRRENGAQSSYVRMGSFPVVQRTE